MILSFWQLWTVNSSLHLRFAFWTSQQKSPLKCLTLTPKAKQWLPCFWNFLFFSLSVVSKWQTYVVCGNVDVITDVSLCLTTSWTHVRSVASPIGSTCKLFSESKKFLPSHCYHSAWSHHQLSSPVWNTASYPGPFLSLFPTCNTFIIQVPEWLFLNINLFIIIPQVKYSGDSLSHHGVKSRLLTQVFESLQKLISGSLTHLRSLTLVYLIVFF